MNRPAQTVLPTDRRAARGSYFALAMLMLVNLLNYLDRGIVGILGQAIKVDLKLDDAQLGFLLGTAFAVFYSVVGIAMGRIADFLSRKHVLACGIVIWSAMTAFGGLASGFVLLAAARIGVGIGEAVANPCSHSLLSDLFPPGRRALALATYLAGTFLGGTMALLLGGVLVGHWGAICSSVPLASACTIPGWKAALFLVGLPGLPLALLVLCLREPARANATGAHGGRIILREFASALPPFTVLTVYRLGGKPAVLRNSALIAIIAATALVLIAMTGDRAQWIAFALGSYAILTWGQVQSHGDKPLFSLTFGDRTFVLCIASVAIIACIIGTFQVWSAPYAMRTFKAPASQVGLGMGLVYLAGAIIGVFCGGWLTDKWRRTDLRAPLWMAIVTLVGLIPTAAVLMTAPTLKAFFVGYFMLAIFSSLWSGGAAAMVQDLVLPRMRGAAAASQSLVAIVIASGIGPYWAGKVSVLTGSLNLGLYSIMVLIIPAAVLLHLAMRRMPFATPQARLDLAISAGERAGTVLPGKTLNHKDPDPVIRNA